MKTDSQGYAAPEIVAGSATNSSATRVPDGSTGSGGDTFIFPMSFAQRLLWLLDQMEPGSTVFITPFALRLTGDVKIAALQESLSEIVRRHEVLRATFRSYDDAPVQVIHPAGILSMPVIDLSNLPEGERDAQMLKLASEEAHRPFDLARDPMMRATLLRMTRQDHVLLLTLHHIVFDGWSRAILVRELAHLYEAFSAGQPSLLPEMRLQYTDFAVWQNQRLKGEVFRKQLSYWKQQLAGIPQSLELPTDRPRQAVGTTNGASISVTLPKSLIQKLKDRAHEDQATLFMVLLAGFQALLYRYSGQEDVVVGSPIANRNRVEVENLIGLFVNTLVMRADLSGNPTFRELLRRVKEVALGAYAHQDLPLEKLVDELQPQRTLSHRPLFQVMFSLRNVPTQTFELSGLKLELLQTTNTSARMDLALFVSEGNGQLVSRWEYNTDLFDAGTIERMATHYEMLLRAVAQNPDQTVAEISMLPEAEKQQLLAWAQDGPKRAWNSPSLIELFEEQVTLHPEDPAFYFGAQSITYRELNDRANRIAHFLTSLSLGTPTTVGVCLDRSMESVAAMLGVLKARCVYLPLDLSYPRERLAYMLQDSRAQVVLTNNTGQLVLPDCKTSVINLDICREQIENQRSDNPGVYASPSDLAYMLYTSGSTGVPKGVVASHKQILNRFEWMWEAYPFDSDEVGCQKTALSFVDSIWELLGPLLRGRPTAIIAEQVLRDPFLFVRELADKKVTRLWLVPTLLASLLDAYPYGLQKQLPQLKFWVSSGEPLPARLLQRFEAAMPHATLFNLYGTSEVWDATWYEPSYHSGELHRVPIGRPIPNVQVYVLDACGRPVPIGIPGELYIAGDGLSQGYLHHPEWTAEKFVDLTFHPDQPRAYKTGDRVRFLADGHIEYLGRFDDQVQLRGYRVELEEIESVLVQHPAVHQAVVVAREDSPGIKRLVAYILATPGSHLSLTEARAHLKQSLPDYMLPAALVELESLPLTPSGKVDRKGLPKPDVQPATSAEAVPPRDELEARLVKIWQEILQTESIGVSDNFFELGGHSLMAVRLMNEIQKSTGVNIPLTALFQGATVEHLAGIVRGTAVVPRTVVQQIQAGESRPAFFAVVLAGTNALGYIPLAKHLGPQQPFYTLQTPGPGRHDTKRPYNQKEYQQVADEYIRAMRAIQPEGPYFIGGTCGGAHIAFEMTRMLETQGQAVDLLAVMDTWVLENTQNRILWKIYYYFDRLQRWWRRPWLARAIMARDALRTRMGRWLGLKSAPGQSEWLTAYWPGDDFVPSQVQSRITVFKIPKQPFYYHEDPLLGWGSRTTSGVDTHVIPEGKHLLLLREPHVSNLADALAQTLERLLSKNGNRPEAEKQAGATFEPAFTPGAASAQSD
jgi:amino acid adenylation domain-containing protein